MHYSDDKVLENNKSLPWVLMSLRYTLVHLFGEGKAYSVQVLVNFVLVQ